MNLVTKSLLVLSAVLMLSACDSPSGTSSGSGKNGVSGSGTGVGTQGYLDKEQTVGDRVFFEYDSAVISSEGQKTLESQAGWLKKYSNVNVTVEGHCDERGTREYNLALGERRAAAAKKFLVAQGVSSSRVSTISYGKERPAVIGSDESAWSQNRRAVTVLTNQ